MRRFVLPAAASVLAGLALGAAGVFGLTFLAHSAATPGPAYQQSSVSSRVQYGDRCFHGHCLPCNSKQDCLDKLPPAIRQDIP